MLKVEHIAKKYTNETETLEVINDIAFNVEKGEIVAIVGPSGCGKTTLLKMIAGLLEPTQGRILVEEKPQQGTNTHCGMVFQSPALFPWLTVRQNIAFGMTLQKMSEKERDKLIDHYLKATNLTKFAHYYPKSISGGMQQRVAVARALANNPKVLLMDEPFAALDAQTRGRMQNFLLQLLAKEQKAVVLVTHDVDEAVLLADTVHVISRQPSEIKATHHVRFPRPRNRKIQQTKEFFDITNEINKELSPYSK